MTIKDLLAKSFLFNLFTLARFSHAKRYLLKGRKKDPYYSYVLAKNKKQAINIWALQQVKYRKRHHFGSLFFWDFNQEVWLANLDQVHGLYEYLQGAFSVMYKAPCQNKRVLDVGGYIGDTARFFLKEGASRVVIYEPALANVLCMEVNLKEYADKIEIIRKGIGAKDGELEISSNYPEGHIGFGNREGAYKVQTTGICFTSLLQSEDFDIAKIDCEGSEQYLLDVAKGDLRKIPYWMIELHDPHIAAKVTEKFLESGFEAIPIEVEEGHQQMTHFRLLPAH